MYVPPALRMPLPQAQALIEAHPFGVLVGDDLQATHLPLLLNRDEGEFGTLYGHFARANPHWQALEGRRVLAIFTGPHAYVSPTWYATRPAVPTWNYAAVHAEGRFERLDGAATAALIKRSLAHFEPGLLNDKVALYAGPGRRHGSPLISHQLHAPEPCPNAKRRRPKGQRRLANLARRRGKRPADDPPSGVTFPVTWQPAWPR